MSIRLRHSLSTAASSLARRRRRNSKSCCPASRRSPSRRDDDGASSGKLMQFDRLRLVGFKSFVDMTELVIAAGLTGIVGPNGCGKSNLVEALRWVMGETSAKRLRGGEMDDVIFAGSAERPGGNI